MPSGEMCMSLGVEDVYGVPNIFEIGVPRFVSLGFPGLVALLIISHDIPIDVAYVFPGRVSIVSAVSVPNKFILKR